MQNLARQSKGEVFFVPALSIFTNSNPVVVEAKSLIQFDGGHVAFNASCFRFDRTSDVRFRTWLVAA